MTKDKMMIGHATPIHHPTNGLGEALFEAAENAHVEGGISKTTVTEFFTEEEYDPVIPPDEVIDALCNEITDPYNDESVGYFTLKRVLKTCQPFQDWLFSLTDDES